MAPPRKRRRREFTAEEVRDFMLDSDFEIEDIVDNNWEEDTQSSRSSESTEERDSSRLLPEFEEHGESLFEDSSGDEADGGDDDHLNDLPAPHPTTHAEPLSDHDWRRLEPDERFKSSRRVYDDQPRLLFDAEGLEPVDFFTKFYPTSIFAHIADETNKYAQQFFDCPAPLPEASRFGVWLDTDEEEIRAFTALQIAMGLVSKPSVPQYWETNSDILVTPGFADVISRNRFQLLNTFLHFNDNEKLVPRGQPGFDPLHKTRPLIDMSQPTYLEHFLPGGYLSIDQSLAPFKGRISYRQYIPNKPRKWGIKFWMLCDAQTGFCLRWRQYVGAEGQDNGDSATEALVKQLTEPFYNTDRVIVMDNYYSSVKLYEDLSRNGLGACGTVRSNRRGLPEEIRRGGLHLAKGDDPVFFAKGREMSAVTWHDVKLVNVLSTVSSNDLKQKQIRSKNAEGGRRTIQKPATVDVYNRFMNGVDKMDQRMSYYRYPHKKIKGYRVTYHFTMEVALVNAYIAFRMAGHKMSTRDFRCRVIEGLLNGYRASRYRRTPSPPIADNEARLTERHFPAEFEDRQHRPDCYVCSDRRRGRRRQTRTYCRQCGLAMCCIPCFEIYHTRKDFRS
ncbi:piggyBac transposable element-derived protein 4-like [Diadema antillarum]|uniref:piggyBac transposable element-derived protein 4-like n=1 Tax=Diadema antillarum TaxID=105358 RepID=UPI003A89A7BB